jgi:hypothetical protein
MKRRSSSLSSAAEEVMGMIQDLCNLAGYGIHSGINLGEKGEAAANYILGKLRERSQTGTN